MQRNTTNCWQICNLAGDAKTVLRTGAQYAPSIHKSALQRKRRFLTNPAAFGTAFFSFLQTVECRFCKQTWILIPSQSGLRSWITLSKLIDVWQGLCSSLVPKWFSWVRNYCYVGDYSIHHKYLHIITIPSLNKFLDMNYWISVFEILDFMLTPINTASRNKSQVLLKVKWGIMFLPTAHLLQLFVTQKSPLKLPNE